jgi:hypothetical protein
MSIKVNCPCCGRSLELGDAYTDYQGVVRCWVCHRSFELSLSDGRLLSMKPTPEADPVPAPHDRGVT